MIPFLDLRAATAELRGEIDKAIARVVDSGWYIGGDECSAFEESFAAFCQVDHAVGTANGLDALILALRALEIGPGDEVILASNTFVATVLAVSAVGAMPVLVEPDPATHNLDPSLVEAAITPATRMILVTHLYGQPADLDPLLGIARSRGLLLVEDAAQAHGAEYKRQRIGGHGDAVCWSFYPSKNLGALGDGGAVTTGRKEVANRIRQLGNYGSSAKYVNEVRGVNSRLDPLQAAVLAVKLSVLDEWNARRRAIAEVYRTALSDLPGLILPHVPDFADPVWHLFVVRVQDRDGVQRRLSEAGVQTAIHYPIPPHRQTAYADLGAGKGSYPVAEALADEVLSLPMGPHLALRDAERVAAAVRSAVTCA